MNTIRHAMQEICLEGHPCKERYLQANRLHASCNVWLLTLILYCCVRPLSITDLSPRESQTRFRCCSPAGRWSCVLQDKHSSQASGNPFKMAHAYNYSVCCKICTHHRIHRQTAHSHWQSSVLDRKRAPEKRSGCSNARTSRYLCNTSLSCLKSSPVGLGTCLSKACRVATTFWSLMI